MNPIAEIASMKFSIPTLVLCLTLAPAAVAPLFGQETDAEVVVKIGGKDYTAEQLNQIRDTLPQQFSQNVKHMSNKAFVDSYANLLALSMAAEQSGLPEEEPYKSELAFLRLNFLAQSYLGKLNTALAVTVEERETYYEEHAEDYSEADVAAIHVEYDPLPELAERAGRTPVSEQDARDRAEKLLSDIRGGADFAAVAKEHSDDKLSAEKGGGIGWLDRDSQLPASLKETIFSLQEGEISEAVKDGGKFYIFKVNEVRAKPYEAVQADIRKKLQGVKLQQKLEEIRATVPVEFFDDEYAAAMPAAQ